MEHGITLKAPASFGHTLAQILPGGCRVWFGDQRFFFFYFAS